MPYERSIFDIFRVNQVMWIANYGASGHAYCGIQEHITVKDEEKLDYIPEIAYLVNLVLEVITRIAIIFHLFLYFAFQSKMNLFNQ